MIILYRTAFTKGDKKSSSLVNVLLHYVFLPAGRTWYSPRRRGGDYFVPRNDEIP